MKSMTLSTKADPAGDLAALTMPWQGLLLRQSRLWFQEQARAMIALERFNDDWLRRRRASAEDAMRTLDRMAATEDMGERVELCSRWMTGVAERMGDDLRSAGACFTRLNSEGTAEAAAPDSPPDRMASGADDSAKWVA